MYKTYCKSKFVNLERASLPLLCAVTLEPVGMYVGQRKFLQVGQKLFDVVGEGDGVRIFENGKGFRKSILFSNEAVDWLMKSFREFRWEKSDGRWGWSREETKFFVWR